VKGPKLENELHKTGNDIKQPEVKENPVNSNDFTKALEDFEKYNMMYVPTPYGFKLVKRYKIQK
jgi:hypothetical protein